MEENSQTETTEAPENEVIPEVSVQDGITDETAIKQPVELSGFSKGFIITDLVFCSIRFLLFLIGLIGLVIIVKQGEPMAIVSGIIEVFSNLGIALVGIPAAIMLLMKKNAGIIAAYATIGFTLLSLFGGLFSLIIKYSPDQPVPMLIGYLLGGGVVLLIRIVLLGLYIKAVAGAKESLTIK